MLDGMADVEEERVFGGVDLSMAARVTGIAAIVVAAAELLSQVAGFSMTQAVYAVLGDDGFFWIFRVLWIILLAATAVVAGGLIVGWRQAPLLWTPGIGPVVLGLVLRWGWWVVEQYADIWGFHQIVVTGDEPSPELVRLSQLAQGVDVAVSILVIALLVTGGVQLLRGRRSST
jgi:hypothetical protein